MGKIVKMQNKINNRTVQKPKTKLDTTGIKTLRLAKLGIENEYSLTPRQKELAKSIRKVTVGTGLAITALASAFAIRNSVSNHVSNQTTQENAYENTILDREAILNDAKSALTNIVLPNGSTFDGAFVNFPSRDEYRNINSVQVNERIRLNDFSVYRYISGHDDNKNNPEIVNEFLDTLLAVANTSTPSQNDLAKLQELTDKIVEMNLVLEGNSIIDLNEKDCEFER